VKNIALSFVTSLLSIMAGKNGSILQRSIANFYNRD